MKGFFDKVQKNLQKDRKGNGIALGGGGGNGIRRNKQQYRGGGKSLGGSKPGELIHISLPNPGPIGVKVEKSSNGRGYAIISQVVSGTQAADANLQRGDIICHAGSDGEEEIMYEQFLHMAAASRRPLEFDVRRLSAIQSSNSSHNTSAEAYSRKQAIIAAAESRDKTQKAKSRPIKKTFNSMDSVKKSNETVNQTINDQTDSEPKSHEARVAIQDAKNRESDLANNLGYNPYDTVAMNAGQARNATVATSHGSIDAGKQTSSQESTSKSNTTTTASVTSADKEDIQVFNETFEEAFAVLVTTNGDDSSLSQSLSIMRKLITNATTKGQQDDESAAKFRKIRLSNPKIKSAICDMHGALELMVTVGFQLVEDTDVVSEAETYLVYPPGNKGPSWLAKALRRMEQYESNI